MTTFTISDERTSPFAERVDWSAPLPLGHCAAVARAYELRQLGPCMSYPAIAHIMATYHGYRRHPSFWRRHLILAGVERRPHGVPIREIERAA